MLMTLAFGANRVMPWGRNRSDGAEPATVLTRLGSEFQISKPHSQTLAPCTVMTPWSLQPLPSNTARAPGAWRTTIGAFTVPDTAIVKQAEYEPPCNHTTSPGRATPCAPNADTRSNGRAADPSPDDEPPGPTKMSRGPGSARAEAYGAWKASASSPTRATRAGSFVALSTMRTDSSQRPSVSTPTRDGYHYSAPGGR